jgi:hypothetical protein
MENAEGQGFKTLAFGVLPASLHESSRLIG